MYDLLSKCNCVSTEGEQLVLMRLSHQLDRLVSKLRYREYLFLAVILYYSFKSVNVVKYACCPVFRRLDVLVVISWHERVLRLPAKIRDTMLASVNKKLYLIVHCICTHFSSTHLSSKLIKKSISLLKWFMYKTNT